MKWWDKLKAIPESLNQRLSTVRLDKKRVPLNRVLNSLYQQLTENNIHQQASSIAFNFTLSLFPTFLFIFTLIPYVASWLPFPDPVNYIKQMLEESFPQGIFEFIAPTIFDIIDNPRADLLSFGFLFALYAASSGVNEMMDTFNKNFHYSERRSYLIKRLVAAGIALLFAFLLILAVSVIIVGELVLSFMLKQKWLTTDLTYYSINLLRYSTVFLIFYISISFIYYIAPAISKHWRFFSVGSTLACTGMILSSYAFSYYLNHFATYNKLYGSIGTMIALLVWFYLLAWILLLGFEINACIVEARIDYEAEKDTKLQMLDEV